MKATAGIALTLIFAFTWNASAFQSASPASARAPYRPSQPANQPHGNTKIAIAWLSEVSGEVELASGFGKEFQRALDHTAVIQGSIIRTGMGKAEVELEDQTTIRVGPDSVIAFPRLELLPSGAKAFTVRGVRGTIYVSLMPDYMIDTKGNDFELAFGRQQLHLKPSGHLRLEMDRKEARLVMRDGKGQVSGPFGSMELARKRTFTFNLVEATQPDVVKKVTANPMDKWDTWAVAFHRHEIASPSSWLR